MKYYVVDTFTDSLFRGNPAGVCLPERDLSDVEMQHIAFENNLAETAHPDKIVILSHASLLPMPV